LVYEREEIVPLLLTFGLFLILEDVVKLTWGVDPYFASTPYAILGNVSILGVAYARYPFMLTILALICGAMIWWLINQTRLGKITLAVIGNRELSPALGINVARVYLFAFVVGAVLATLSGAFVAPMIAVVPGIGLEVIVLSFAVVAIGGMGSVGGAALGALLVGLTRAAAIYLYPELDLFAIYIAMTLVLIFKPEGLFAEMKVRRI
jgi:branched-chain amino acid transport system permease protein